MGETFYEIQFGRALDLSTGFMRPEWTSRINQSQFDIIEQLANIEVGSKMERYYIINNLRLQIVPIFKPSNT